MAVPEKKVHGSEEGGTIIQFPMADLSQSSQSSIDTSAFIESIFESPQFDEKLKLALEGHIWNAWFRTQSDLVSVDDPFDAVYLADLQPDVMSAHSMSALGGLAHIKDLSDTIQIDDGFDD